MLLNCRDISVRNYAYSLCIRVLHFDSTLYSRIIPSYLDCIPSEVGDIRRHALRSAFEFFPFCNEHSMELMRRLFQGGKEGLPELVKIVNSYLQL